MTPIRVGGPTTPKEVRVDMERGIAYIRITDGKVVRTVEDDAEPNVWLDLDSEGLLIGIEVLGPIDTVGVADAAERYLGPDASRADAKAVSRALEAVERLLEPAS